MTFFPQANQGSRARGFKRALLFLLVPAFCISLSGCGLFLRAPHETLRDIMPRETDVPGWEIRTPHRYYPEKSIKGSSGEPAGSGVSEYITGIYSSLSKSRMELMITLYRCTGSLDSFSLFSRERIIDTMKEQHERDYYIHAYGASFVKGEYFVKLHCENGDDSMPEELAVFRRVIEENIALYSKISPLPEEVFFMAENNLLSDLVYYNSGYPSLEELGPLFVRRTRAAHGKVIIFYSRKSDNAEAERLMAILLRKSSRGFIVSKTGGLLYAFNRARGSGFTAVSRHKEWIFGTIDAENKTEAELTLQEIYREIRGAALPGKG